MGANTSTVRLCSSCSKLDFSAVGIQGIEYAESETSQPILKTFKKARKCFLCRKATELFEEWAKHQHGGLNSLYLKDGRVDIHHFDHWSIEEDASDDFNSKHVVQIILSCVIRNPREPISWVGPHFFLQKIIAEPMTVTKICDDFPAGDWPTVEPYMGRLRPQMADCRLFRKWIDSCCIDHGDSCTVQNDASFPPFIRLIDTEAKCLIQLSAADLQAKKLTWAALSYVWGTTKVPVLTNGLLSEFSTLDHFTSSAVPKTIYDAISLSSRLGIRYLWVDSVCIIQDSDVDKAIFLPAMCAIYGLSTVTIINAAGEDADHGLPGISAPRFQEQQPFDFKGVRVVKTMDPPGKGEGIGFLEGSTWCSRAWTFQESLLPSRLLIFTEDQVYWQCLSTTWCEDGHWEVHHIRGAPRIYRDAIPDINTAKLWSSVTGNFDKNYRVLVERYSERAMTQQSDGLNAFSGILEKLQRLTGYQFFWGLPTIFLGTALSWPTRRIGSQRRKATCEIQYGGRLVKTQFPSWSWAGWSSPIYYDQGFGYLDARDAGLVFHRIQPDGSIEAFSRNEEFREFESPILQKRLPVQDQDLSLSWRGRKQEVMPDDIPVACRESHVAAAVLAVYTSYAKLDINPMFQPPTVKSPSDDFTKPSVEYNGRSLKPVWFQRPVITSLSTYTATFIIIGRDTRESIKEETRLSVLLVEEDEFGAFQRNGMLHVSEQEWCDLNHREWRLVFLR
jgi:hypothetical protein